MRLQRMSGFRPLRLLFASGSAVDNDAVYATRNQNAAVCHVKAQRFGDGKFAGCTANAAKNLLAFTSLLIL
jgi:hypothetical protein